MSKYNYEYGENNYKTPPELYNMALDEWKITRFALDTCCSDRHIPADEYYSAPDRNGLTEPWKEYSWCNPPFNDCAKWVAKAYNENKERGINIAMLLPVRTETKYWHDYILYNPNVEIVWLRKGFKFLDKDNKEMGVFKNALALVYFKGN